MKTKKRPTKRRKKVLPTAYTGVTGVNNLLPGQIVWYPALPPRKTTWITHIKEVLQRLFL